MKKTKILSILLLTSTLTFTACSQELPYATMESNVETATEEESVSAEEEKTEKPELSQIRAICKLATLECYYHNVAKNTKSAGTGLSHLGEKDRKFWVEYSGVVKLGVDMSRGSIEIEGNQITIYMPEAEIISIKADMDSISDTIYEKDSLNKNKITSEDVTTSVKEAEEQIRQNIESDSSLLVDAQERAQKLIKNYIDKIGEASGTKYTIEWETISDKDESAN